jgi:hypothetical protein
MKNELTTTRKKIFIAILPWAIIALTATSIGSIALGWNIRSADYSRIQGEANAMVQTQLKDVK